MATLSAIRERTRSERLTALRERVAPLVSGRAGLKVLLFGSLARGDWDAFSDVDLLAVGPDAAKADQLADALLAARVADDVIALPEARWNELGSGTDPYWQAIARDAICLASS